MRHPDTHVGGQLTRYCLREREQRRRYPERFREIRFTVIHFHSLVIFTQTDSSKSHQAIFPSATRPVDMKYYVEAKSVWVFVSVEERCVRGVGRWAEGALGRTIIEPLCKRCNLWGLVYSDCGHDLRLECSLPHRMIHDGGKILINLNRFPTSIQL